MMHSFTCLIQQRQKLFFITCKQIKLESWAWSWIKAHSFYIMNAMLHFWCPLSYGNLSSGNSSNQRHGASSPLLQWPLRILDTNFLLPFLQICCSCKIGYLAVVVIALEPKATHLPPQMHPVTSAQVLVYNPL